MANKHKETDGDAALAAAREAKPKSPAQLALAEAKQRRAEEIARYRLDPTFNEIVPEGWVERTTGFPPWLPMSVGMMFRAEICYRDDRDEFVDRQTGEIRPFVRYHMRLTAPAMLVCRRGPNDERGEEIAVQAGQIFTMGEYASLESEFQALMGLEVAVVCQKERKFEDRDSGDPRKQFLFDLFTSPETDRMLVSQGKEDREKLREAYRRARQAALLNRFIIPVAPALAPAAQ